MLLQSTLDSHYRKSCNSKIAAASQALVTWLIILNKENEVMMTASEAAEAAKGLTFEKVWVTIEELN
jgi:hypothetical protein